MSEQAQAGEPLIEQWKRPDLRFIDLTMEEAKHILGYLILRHRTPIIGLQPSANKPEIYDLSKSSLGHFTQILGDAFIRANLEQSETVLLGVTDDEMVLLFKDFANQSDFGDPVIIERVRPIVDSIKAKWEGAVG
jgi:hypothetical protein